MDGDHQGEGSGPRKSYPYRPFGERSPPATTPASALAPAADAAPGADLALIVGRNLRRLRVQRGYSLQRLAEASGVSRAMLSQIELGKSAPSIRVLWKVATALDVRFSAFTVGLQADATWVMRAANTKVLLSGDGAFSSRPLFPADAHRRFEFYQLRLAPGGSEEAAAHATGTVENLVVASGCVDVGVGHKQHRLEAGDAIHFGSDVPHSYHNPGDDEAVMYLVLGYESRPTRRV